MKIKMSCEERVAKKYEIDFTAEDIIEFKQYVLSFSYVNELVLRDAAPTTIEQDIKDLTFSDIVTAFKDDDIRWSNKYRTVCLTVLVKAFLKLKFYKFHPHDLSDVIKQEICYWTED